MRQIVLLLLVIVFGGCAHIETAQPAQPVNITAMTYNIRLDLASDGQNAWAYRKDNLAALIRREAPDVMGLQEVLLGQRLDLEKALPNYRLVGVARDDGQEAGEFSSLAYRTDRFTLVEAGTFWLSPTPETPSKGWDAALPRIATWAVLRHNESGQDIRVLNTHFDHVGKIARHQSAQLLAEWAISGPQAGLPTIIMGDFNSAPDSDAYRALTDTQDSKLSDSRTISITPPYGPPGTFTAFKIDRDAAAPIDHIFVSSRWRVLNYAVLTQHWGGRLPSDHYPVMITAELAAR